MSAIAQDGTPMSDYARLLAAATAGGGVSDRMELLDHMRMHHIREPKVVLAHGQRVLNDGGAFSLGDRRWDISEQVAVAALDVGADDVAEALRKQLEQKFPDSQRVKRLEGMCCEAQEKWAEASLIYEQMLEKNPANMIAMKRLVCVHKAQGKVPEAIAELTKILETFQTDPECWKELVTLYMSQGDMAQAVYCQEEVVMCDPRNYQAHNRYADLLYTSGGQSNIRSARRQYAQSLELNPRNMRAAYGICLASFALAGMAAGDGSGKNKKSSGGSSGSSSSFDYIEPDEDELNKKLFEFGLSLLKEHYAESPLRAQVEALSAEWEAGFGEAGSVARSGGNKNNSKKGSSSSRSKGSGTIGELD